MRYTVKRTYNGKQLETRLDMLARFNQPDPEKCEVPEAAFYIWQWFWELASQRKELSPLGFGEIKAWSELMNTPLYPWEVKAIIRMDDQYLRTHQDESNSVRELDEARRKSQTKGR